MSPPKPESKIMTCGGFATTWSGSPAKHALEDRVDLLEMISEVEVGFKLLLTQMFAHVLVGREQRQKVAIAGPDLHGIALHQPVGLLARDALLGQRQQHALRMHEPTEAVEIPLHRVRIDHELVDDAGETRQDEI